MPSIPELIKLPEGNWVDPRAVDSVTTITEEQSPRRNCMVEVTTRQAVIAIGVDYNYGRKQADEIRDEIAERINNARCATEDNDRCEVC